jgi:D-glycero-alpha-D-manno-heptose 1-phosphate guanylyltransferase
MLEAIVLAGGLGTRLSSVLDGLPKPMAPIGGRPFLEILLNSLLRHDCQRAILSVGYRSNVIKEYFGDQFGNMRIEYSEEKDPLGTGGAIRQAISGIAGKQCLVLNGDTVVTLDYTAMLREHVVFGSKVSIAVIECADSGRYGSLLINNGIIEKFAEKSESGSGLINAGVYVLDRDINWGAVGEKFSLEKDFLTPFVADLRPHAFLTSGYFIDIGIPEDYARAQKELVQLFE